MSAPNLLPLSERMRPQSFDALQGQIHLTGETTVLRRALASGNVPSIILWGPSRHWQDYLSADYCPAGRIALYTLSAISAGVKDVREIIERSKMEGKAILFIDEIHRFNKSQQDALLGAVEKGIITLIGATTENPSFEVNAALLSRCQVYVLPLSEEEMVSLLQKAIRQDEILKQKDIQLKETAALLNLSGGDARRLLNLLELVVTSGQPGQPILITDEKVMAVAQRK